MIIKYILKSKKNAVYTIIYNLIATVFTIFIPVITGMMVAGLAPSDTSNFSPETLWILFFIALGCGFMVYLSSRAGRLKGAVVSAGALYNLRKDIHNAIYRQSFSYFDSTETGQLIARATSDVEETQMIFGMGINMGISSLLLLGGVLIAAFLLNLPLALIIITLVILSLIGSTIIAKKMKPLYLETRQSFGELTNTIRENIVGAQVVRMFNNQDKERGKFQKSNNRYFNAAIRTARLNSIYMPLNFVLIGLMIVINLFLGGFFILQGTMTLQTLITFQGWIGTLMFPMVMIGQLFMMYIQADAALTRVRHVLDSTPDVVDSENAIHLPLEQIKGNVEFENVSFGYTPEHRVLQNVSFKVPKGKKLAIIGTTGSGKSTIINLLPRFYEVNEGSITIDGIDIRNILLKDLRKSIGIVSQETFLFNKTIAENIAYGMENATRDEIIKASKIAHLHDFISSLPEGYDTNVGERGTHLSGGQKQRLSIARALIIKPKVLIFDDSTSSVDVETEFKIQQALDQVMQGTTTLIITQRISTFRHADQILVLDKGRVVGIGNHANLFENNVLYRQIYETLFQKQKELITQSQEEVKEVYVK